MNKMFFSLLIYLSFACNISDSNVADSKNVITIDNVDSECVVSVLGMMCEKGCAKVIQETLNATEGVQIAEVSFVDKEATIKFNSQKINASALLEIIKTIKEGKYDAKIKVVSRIN